MTFSQIIIKSGKEQSLKRFHPWVFSGAIKATNGKVHSGDTVEVVSEKGEYLGHGHCAEGTIAVRIFSFTGYDGSDAFWKNKLQSAFDLRKKIGLAGSTETNIYRLVHAEGDGLPGLIIDIYAETAVIQTHSDGMHEQRPAIVSALKAIYGDQLKAIFDKSADKLKTNSGQEMANEYLFGELTSNVALENGCKFKVDWEEGQKTGFFIDQREHRKLLGEYAKGKKVLNTFGYTGGFSIYALKQGATLVHTLDSSQRALDIAEENVALNNLDPTKHAVIKADAVEYIKNLKEDYDIIVLDPPAFAKNMSAKHKAVQGYIRINEAALRQIKSGGIIFTFSCSQAVDKQLFRNSIMAASIQAGRKVRILHQMHQPADHPISMYHPEGEYLKGLVLEVE